MSVPKGYPMPHKQEDKLPDSPAMTELYWDAQMSQDKIGELYGVGRWIVQRKMARLGIPVRTFAESQKLSGKSKMGAGNVNWNGKERKDNKGYVLIYKPGHPRASQNYVLEHIVNWETSNGKILPQGWVIHHLNGVKNDNRPSNLVALPNRKHSFVLAVKAKRIQELEGLLRNQGMLL